MFAYQTMPCSVNLTKVPKREETRFVCVDHHTTSAYSKRLVQNKIAPQKISYFLTDHLVKIVTFHDKFDMENQ